MKNRIEMLEKVIKDARAASGQDPKAQPDAASVTETRLSCGDSPENLELEASNIASADLSNGKERNALWDAVSTPDWLGTPSSCIDQSISELLSSEVAMWENEQSLDCLHMDEACGARGPEEMQFWKIDQYHNTPNPQNLQPEKSLGDYSHFIDATSVTKPQRGRPKKTPVEGNKPQVWKQHVSIRLV